MRILSLDLSMSRTGWAVFDGSEIHSGTQGFVAPAKLDPAFRYYLFSTWLDSLIERYTPELIVYEQAAAHHSSQASNEIAYGLITRVKEQAAIHGCKYNSLYSTSLKLWATGKGNADKGDMKLRASIMCPGYYPHLDEGGDEADAILLCLYFIENPDGPKKKPRKPNKKKGVEIDGKESYKK